MIFDDVRAKEPVINEYFCRGRHNNCSMIYLSQNLSSLDRRSVRENCNLFILFEQRGKVLISIYQDFLNNVELSYNDFANIYVIRYGKSLIIILSLIQPKIKILMVN